MNTLGRSGWTALFAAVFKGHVDVVKVLIRNALRRNSVDDGEIEASSHRSF